MVFEFINGPDFNFLTQFRNQYGGSIQDDTLTIPSALGEGFVRKIDLGPEFKLLIHQYTLREEFVLKRMPSDKPNDLVSIIFHNVDEPVSLATPDSQVYLARNNEFAVQIASADLESTTRFPANRLINFTVIGLSSTKLKQLLRLENPNRALKTILSGVSGFLFYESIGPDVRKTLKQITDARQVSDLSTFFYWIKVEELLYLVVEKLLRRESIRHSSINREDIDKLFTVRTAVLANLNSPPQLHYLARMTGMSQTKLTQLFKQVFGDSIYTYFQKARMEEAAFLLKQGGYSVSDVGYRLGFTNLSHFSRLFHKHYGIKPKVYASFGG